MFSDDDVDEAGPSPGSTAATGDSPQASDSAVKRKKYRNGLITRTNGVIYMRELILSEAVPSKDCDDCALPLFKAKPTLGYHSLL